MKVLIVGGGIAGLTLAYALHRNGHEPLVVEKSSHLRDEGYMIDFFGPGYDVSERLGLLSDLEEIHYQIPHLTFVDASGKEKFSVAYTNLRKNLFGGRHYNFMRGDLERLLYSRIDGRVPVRFGMSVESFEQDGTQVEAELTDGSTDTFDLLVGADGVHSHVRALAFGDEREFLRPLGYYTAAFVVNDPDLGENFADAFYTLTVPGRQVAIYPIRGGKLATFFIHKIHQPLTDFSPESVIRELHAAYGDMDWVVPSLLERCGYGPVYFDEVAQIRLPFWSGGRVVLLGDACQCVSLLAGQGASMAVAGAYVLTEELEASKGDIAGALVRYERRLRPDIEEKQAAGRRMARWFVPDGQVRLAIRETVMRLSAKPPASLMLKRQFAAGKKIKL